MSNERIEWMDVFRGIGMCCVILWYMHIPYALALVIFSFHISLFFFSSWYLYFVAEAAKLVQDDIWRMGLQL